MSRRIGIFDSGVGGLTVLREIHGRLPDVETVYLGDTARVPYGIRSAEVVTRYALENTRFLVGQGIDALVVACNTATAVALEDIRDTFDPLPVLGVVEPGSVRAAAATTTGRVAVLATEATIRSGAYEKAIVGHRSDAEVTGRACPLFVPLAEEGWVDNDVARVTATHYLADLKDSDIDTVVLGCTHYPLLMQIIGEVLGEKIRLVDSASSTADALVELIGSGESSGSNAHRFFVTDAPERFARVGAPFLGAPIDAVEHVDVVAG